jgi:hypothetical protein
MPERFFTDDGRLVHHRQFDAEPHMERARLAREAPQQPMSDSWHVASIPAWLITIWAKEAGVRWDDPALKDVIRRKLMSGEYAAFRVREGNF